MAIRVSEAQERAKKEKGHRAMKQPPPRFSNVTMEQRNFSACEHLSPQGQATFRADIKAREHSAGPQEVQNTHRFPIQARLSRMPRGFACPRLGFFWSCCPQRPWGSFLSLLTCLTFLTLQVKKHRPLWLES